MKEVLFPEVLVEIQGKSRAAGTLHSLSINTTPHNSLRSLLSYKKKKSIPFTVKMTQRVSMKFTFDSNEEDLMKKLAKYWMVGGFRSRNVVNVRVGGWKK